MIELKEVVITAKRKAAPAPQKQMPKPQKVSFWNQYKKYIVPGAFILGVILLLNSKKKK